MLVRCTGKRNFDTHLYPHREFFGVLRGRFRSQQQDWRGDYTVGRISLSELEDNAYVYSYAPTPVDIPIVDGYLQQKGLPRELTSEILKLAGYEMKRRLVVVDDPFHPDNGLELRKYLNYCWQMLVRTEVVAKAMGCHIEWASEIMQCIWELWGESGERSGMMVDWSLHQDEEGDETYLLIYPQLGFY
ncbi:hypothetical protein EJ08DRAFT_591417 [Tothia fuscella]|uniref:Uncharacterized protein n=1 Tax=Tothia fuscella TaxID=1048955 RepID=A0A9P4NNZ7_9PEZI|nr:hypothetical protein EJ08DRAFT_591417 [Tothia fuscella]